jgi:hypothetical protein
MPSLTEAAFSRLTRLELSQTNSAFRITGSLPVVSALPLLKYLDLSDQSLTGPLSAFDGNPLLIGLYLSNNMLSSNIPSFASCKNLKSLNLFNNLLAGVVPSFADNEALDRDHLYLQNNIGITGLADGLTCKDNATIPWVSKVCQAGLIDFSSVPPGIDVSGALLVRWNYMALFAPTISMTLLAGHNPEDMLLIDASVPAWQKAYSWTLPSNYTNVNAAVAVMLCFNDWPRSCFTSKAFLLNRTGATTEVPLRGFLMQFYIATGGPGWLNSAKWNTTASVCEWYGVRCGGLQLGSNATVLESLFLKNNNLVGFLPPFFFREARYLDTLHLHENKLEGPLPDLVCDVLSDLNLSNNKLSQALPTFNCPVITSISLWKNTFSGPIPNFGSCPLLHSLALNNNQFSGGIPSFDANLELKVLRLSYNRLSGSLPV